MVYRRRRHEPPTRSYGDEDEENNENFLLSSFTTGVDVDIDSSLNLSRSSSFSLASVINLGFSTTSIFLFHDLLVQHVSFPIVPIRWLWLQLQLCSSGVTTHEDGLNRGVEYPPY